ncbi:wax ester/triacylglycerol synthase domain-containing protein [Microbacterium thalassium]|uniref:O-acyltransferase WSD1-like N-terminal domain-containing protein n=1 Tax=Microbacterium thalassium TaxID=362649 RepID=A0A7X0KTP3_9MICO|nr:wax ester/triacylglycerol synthase domain-containing protein [Microbacterium thalassium]MBB6390258.1 hypothetical protein [Microbacterium thalassium]
MTRPPVRVELIRTLDEQKIVDSIVYEAMHIGAVIVMDGAPFLRPDGTIDRERIHAQLRSSLGRVPEFSMRLMHAPLGITTPAWVPDEHFDLRDHVTFDDSPTPLTGETVPALAGFGRPPLPQDRPLWDVRFTVLDTGEIALGARMHHVVGDGEWGFSVIKRVTRPEPQTPDHSAALPHPGRPPRTSLAIPVVALRRFLAANPTPAAAWHEYWRKPFVKRVRRAGGRCIRPLKEHWIRRTGMRDRMLPATRTAMFEVDASRAARDAARLRGSLTDLLVAAATRAVDDDERGIDLMVPVSRRRRGAGGDSRNHISMARVHTAPGAGLADRVAGIRETVRAIVRGEGEPDTPRGRMVGYATLMQLSDRPLWFGDARVTRIAFLPAGDPRSEISVLGTVYDGTLYTTIASRLEFDVDAMAGRIRADLADAAAPARADAVDGSDRQEAA